MTRTISLFRSSFRWRLFWPITFAASTSILVYLSASALMLRIGFPLDDAWIHQTYARNLALSGEWAFLPGEPSAGSTSPLWSLLLAFGYWMRFSSFTWTFILGWLTLLVLGVAGSVILQNTQPPNRNFPVLAGCFLALEWHLAWSAVSGMETLLFSFIPLIVLMGLSSDRPFWLGLGLLAGFGVWLRPDGITLLGPVLLAAGLGEQDWGSRSKAWLWTFTGAAVCVLPYGLFNHSLSGFWLPNTFFAKQAEYAVLRQVPFGERLLQQIITVIVGPGVILIPGFLLGIFDLYRQRSWGWLGMVIWLIAYLGIYAMRLPVTYQHGRYLVPILPVFFTISLLGMQIWVTKDQDVFWRRILAKAWIIAWLLLTLIFFLLGARAYARDVAVIESEMVATARWVALNTPEDALIAAHDIGALGYFGNRRIIDLAGLVSPQVISFIRDEVRIAEYLDQEEADYLITFPGWYPYLVERAEPVFNSGGSFSPKLGGENMQVYRWR